MPYSQGGHLLVPRDTVVDWHWGVLRQDWKRGQNTQLPNCKTIIVSTEVSLNGMWILEIAKSHCAVLPGEASLPLRWVSPAASRSLRPVPRLCSPRMAVSLELLTHLGGLGASPPKPRGQLLTGPLDRGPGHWWGANRIWPSPGAGQSHRPPRAPPSAGPWRSWALTGQQPHVSPYSWAASWDVSTLVFAPPLESDGPTC